MTHDGISRRDLLEPAGHAAHLERPTAFVDALVAVIERR